MAADPQHAHLLEELHVFAQYEGDKSLMGSCYSRAVKLIRLVLTGGTIVPSGHGLPSLPAFPGAAGVCVCR